MGYYDKDIFSDIDFDGTGGEDNSPNLPPPRPLAPVQQPDYTQEIFNDVGFDGESCDTPQEETCFTCKMVLPTDCIKWFGELTPVFAIKPGEDLTSIITKIENYISEVVSSVDIVNLGFGEPLYAGVTLSGEHSFKTLRAGSNVTLSSTPTEVTVSVSIPAPDVIDDSILSLLKTWSSQKIANSYEPIFSKNTAFNKNFGTISGTVAEGNDSRIINGQTAFSWGNHSTMGYLTLADLSGYATQSWVSINFEPAFIKNTAFNKNFGTTSGTVAEGNDTRITNGQTAYSWGDHSTAGYEPAFAKNTAFNKDFGTTSGTVMEGNDIRVLNGNTAFSWGDHSLVGYLTAVDLLGYATEVWVNNNYIPLSQKAANNGVATLDNTGKIPNSQLPPLAITEVFTANSQMAQLALVTQEGDVCIRTDINKSYIRNSGTSGTMSDWNELLSPASPVLSVNGYTGAITLTYTDVGAEPAFGKNTAFNKNFGTTAGTVAQGNHTHALTDIASAGGGIKFTGNAIEAKVDNSTIIVNGSGELEVQGAGIETIVIPLTDFDEDPVAGREYSGFSYLPFKAKVMQMDIVSEIAPTDQSIRFVCSVNDIYPAYPGHAWLEIPAGARINSSTYNLVGQDLLAGTRLRFICDRAGSREPGKGVQIIMQLKRIP